MKRERKIVERKKSKNINMYNQMAGTFGSENRRKSNYAKSQKYNNEDMSNQIEFIEFENVSSLKPFLASLFQLKPTLITSSFDKLRVVIEVFGGHRNENTFDLQSIEEIVEYMREVGCKVPVLVFSDIEQSPDSAK